MAQPGAQHDRDHGIYKKGIQLFQGFLFLLEDLFHEEPPQYKGRNPKQVIILYLKKAQFEKDPVRVPVDSEDIHENKFWTNITTLDGWIVRNFHFWRALFPLWGHFLKEPDHNPFLPRDGS